MFSAPVAIFVAILGSLALLNAQSVDWFSSLPPCAQKCAIVAANRTGCDVKDIKCLCSSETFSSDYRKCIAKTCLTKDEYTVANDTLTKYCQSYDWTAGLPDCAKKCAIAAAAAAGCKITDTKCLCSSDIFLSEFKKCVYENCRLKEELIQVNSTISQICPDGPILF
ncbi:hypothetical protein BDQ12DRAFT_725752 [Crucibulum laeve]|uniref:CFEM domain-containing protein n=1 Tax=Crucibulum laeve TaxID=68775 RepID=A0A5C3LRG7_9AGAR|nr:hypothetical protein BDQ12DRAFT_725752 [Crucibulum laeve]